MLEIIDLKKSYGEKPVLRGVNLKVEPGEILGLIGSNGAGKTTIISIAAGLRTCDSGQVHIGSGRESEWDVVSEPRRAAGLIGLAPQDLGVYPMLTAEQNLMVFGELAGLGARAARARAHEVAEGLGLAGELAQTASTLSGGQARRLHTGMALMHRPSVLFLDEPTVGADVAARRAILGVVRSLAEAGAAIVYTTHYLTEVVDLGAHVAILEGGRIVLRDSVQALLSSHARPTVAVVTDGAPADLPGWVVVPDGPGGVQDRWSPSEGLLDLHTPTELVAGALARLPRGTRLVGIEISPPTLESAFLDVTGRAIAFDDNAREDAPDAIFA
ncbi:MAG: ABC transporter ATP-binding protein [Demequinaceae bacterium]|nr:ABC transporter ATP-binding protein [Demequinaceae bacterium]